MTGRNPGEETLFDAARQIGRGAERRAFLDARCAGEAAKRSRVEALLAAEDEAERFFEHTLAGFRALVDGAAAEPFGGTVACAEEKSGSRIGRYEVLEKIGEGGCGVVYMAEQLHPVRRRVALKIIKLGMDTKSVIRRFEAERQALAMMDHPNIAMVLDAGATESGRPYFVMELVKGLKITDYCDRNRLGTRERLGLFIQVCQAIQHAHQKGVIHRDIKPSNILITLHDGVPVPKVIDFGIAKATETMLTDKTLFTAYWQIMGTPAYMSPEQAEMSGMDVDTRSDIYSLGVLLYELLTGRTPFDAATLLKSGVDELRRTLRATDPPRPSRMLLSLAGEELARTAGCRRAEVPRLVSQVSGDLDWVVMKALEKDRSRRYETANGLALDVQRHLAHLPVTARPPTAVYQFRKLVRRNKAAFVAASAVTVTLLMGLAASSWLYLRERDARRRAVVAERRQVELRKEAEAGRAGEALLREQAETREKITQAVVSVRYGNHPAADAIVKDLKVSRATLEGAEVYRTLGEWHAYAGRWKEAAERFSSLLQVNQLEWKDQPSLDYVRASAAWIELGDLAGYEEFRKSMLGRYWHSSDPISAERTIKCCLVLPADAEMMARLAPLAEVSVRSFDGKSEDLVNEDQATRMTWRMLSIALMEYRLGRFEHSALWSRRCLAYREELPARVALGKTLLAMALFELHQGDQSASELAAAREIIDARFAEVAEVGWEEDYHWFDWVMARVHLREAMELFARGPSSAAGAD
ncbi:serine/threonine protein kinase [Luteolibacter marinus]|uniref:serine/threonine protein kinase n=1 Tax=Luteolibacter marinus TaxID=2776705 RepID=UPI0018672356|nr:serine/threonine-protein kinase [Luteolibacter marinus]